MRAGWLLLAGALLCRSQVQTQLFQADSPYSSGVRAIARDTSGNVFVTGYSGQGAFVAKVDAAFRTAFYAPLPGDAAVSNAIAIDSAGDVYVTGATPATRTAPATTTIGCASACGADAFVAKLDGKSGGNLFVTYLGGKFADDGRSLAIARDGTIYVAGQTSSLDFPVTPGAPFSERPTFIAGFVARLSADGKALLASTYWNGTLQAMAVNASGSVVVTGSTNTPLPGTAGAYQPSTPYVNLMTSSDRGSSWTNLAAPGRVIDVEADPKQAGVVYAATMVGLFRSRDRGASWSAIPRFDSITVTGVTVDPTDSNTMYARATTDTVQTSAGAVAIQALWKTTDGGLSWTKLKALDSSDSALAINPQRPSTLYLTNSSNKSTIISADGGATWNPATIPFASGFVMDAVYGSTVYAGSSRGLVLYRSIDAGQHWDAIADPFPNPFSNVGSTALFASGSTILHGSQIFRASAGGGEYTGMRRTGDGGKTWADVPGVPATSGFMDRHDPKSVYVGGPAGAFASADLGVTWRSLRGGMDNADVRDVSAGPDGALYAVSYPQGAGFLAELDASLTRVAYLTWYGCTCAVTPRAIAVDGSGRVVIAGTTASRALPATVGQRSLAGYTDGFVARFSGDGSRLDFATFLGGRSADELPSLALSPDGEIYLAGSTTSDDFPLTSNALQRRFRATASAGYLTILGADGGVRYSSYLGGSYWDWLDSAVVAGGYVYLGGGVGSRDFPGASLSDGSSYSVAALLRIPLSALVATPRRTPGIPVRPPIRKNAIH